MLRGLIFLQENQALLLLVDVIVVALAARQHTGMSDVLTA